MKRIILSQEISKQPGCKSELDIQPEIFKIIHSVAINSAVVLIKWINMMPSVANKTIAVYNFKKLES